MSDRVVSGSRSLHRLIYCSRQAENLAGGLEREVAAIVEASCKRNGGDGLTGLLLAYDGWFVQALEGEHRTVMTTYGRILRDPRHHDSKILSSAPADGRAFGAWSMCARTLSAKDRAILEVLDRGGRVSPPDLSGPAALRLLSTVAGIQARAA